MTDRRFARFALGTLVFNVGVILFGAVVRATGSGAGCGSHWPTCGGDVVPLSGSAERFIEFGHRASSGVALVLVAILVLWAIRTRRRGDPVRIAAIASGVLIVNEALIGAALVLFEWVGDDRSAGRAVSITVHLVNTFLLLAALTATAWWASGRPVPPRRPHRATAWLVGIGAGALILVGATGAITALGDTLFPPHEVGVDHSGSFLVSLRWVHPVLAVGTGLYLLHLARVLPVPDRMRGYLAAVVVTQLTAGVVNIALAAPVWMQVVHLLIADVLWIGLVVIGSTALSERAEVMA
ncbi:MAG: COX15/CtaA family protein [Acidimicrobiia bacterium]